MNALEQSSPCYADIRQVRLTDSFYAPWLEKIRRITIPDVFKKFLSDGSLGNYERVIRGERGTHKGEPWAHGLICEVIRGVSDLLAVYPDGALEARLDNENHGTPMGDGRPRTDRREDRAHTFLLRNARSR